MLNDGICSTIGIIGSGAIGSRITYRLSTAKHNVNVYSSSLTNSDETIQKKRYCFIEYKYFNDT